MHVLTPQERAYYDLESFWGHGDQERYVSPSLAAAPAVPPAAPGNPAV